MQRKKAYNSFLNSREFEIVPMVDGIGEAKNDGENTPEEMNWKNIYLGVFFLFLYAIINL